MKVNNSIQTSQTLTGLNSKLNSRDSYGNTPLHTAAWQGDYDWARSLIDQGADIEAKNNYGHTALHAAAQNGYWQIVEYLLHHKANVNARNVQGNTPLRLAVSNGQLQVAKYLMNKSINLAAKDKDSLLLEAIKSQNIKLVQFLIDNNANLAVKDEDGNSLLQIAISKTHINMMLVKLLLQQKEAGFLEAKNMDGNTPLHIAILNDDLDLVKFFAEAGANLEATDEAGGTALHVAAWDGHTEIAKYLVEQGADLEAEDDEGNTPLHIAILNDKIALVKYLAEEVAMHKPRSIDEVKPNPVSPRFFAVAPQIGYAASNTSFPELDSNSSQINHGGVQTSDAHLNGTVLLLSTLANKLAGTKRYNNAFFKEGPRVRLEFANDAVHAINNFPSMLDSMTEKLEFNKTFKL